MGVFGKIVLVFSLVGQWVWAEGAPAAAQASPVAQGREGITPFIPLIMIFGVFYFLILRPQQKRQKEQHQFIRDLKRGDMVVTQAGIIGTIKTVGDKFVTLEVDQGVSLKILKSQILESAAKLKEDKNTSEKEATT
jgi:preprotein translocase subunit YajC